MVTATLTDDGPTTTITFDGFTVISLRVGAKGFNPIALPYPDGRLVVFVGQWERVWKIKFYLKNDAGWPGSGDSAADKRKELVTFLMTGGDSEWFYTLTFDSEDSTPGTPVTEIYTGFVKNLMIRSVAGDNVVKIEGDFEFWESDED
jgi:hypothetical protein